MQSSKVKIELLLDVCNGAMNIYMHVVVLFILSLILQVFCLTPDKLYSVLLCAAKCWDTLEVLWLQNYYFKIFLICMCTVFFPVVIYFA